MSHSYRDELEETKDRLRDALETVLIAFSNLYCSNTHTDTLTLILATINLILQSVSRIYNNEAR